MQRESFSTGQNAISVSLYDFKVADTIRPIVKLRTERFHHRDRNQFTSVNHHTEPRIPHRRRRIRILNLHLARPHPALVHRSHRLTPVPRRLRAMRRRHRHLHQLLRLDKRLRRHLRPHRRRRAKRRWSSRSRSLRTSRSLLRQAPSTSPATTAPINPIELCARNSRRERPIRILQQSKIINREQSPYSTDHQPLPNPCP